MSTPPMLLVEYGPPVPLPSFLSKSLTSFMANFNSHNKVNVAVLYLLMFGVLLGRNRRCAWWKLAVQRSMNWELSPSMEHGMHGPGQPTDVKLL